MSDCSIQAMTPKEPHKTCETCDRYYNVRPFMRQGACALDDLDEDGCVPIRNADDEACARWLAVELPLEQRFQQLEQVAKEMIGAIWSSDLQWVYEERLRKLGVSLDA